jgi:hypothetical protein
MSVLYGLDMLMYGTVRADVVLLHDLDQVGLAQVWWGFGFFLANFDNGVENFRYFSC